MISGIVSGIVSGIGSGIVSGIRSLVASRVGSRAGSRAGSRIATIATLAVLAACQGEPDAVILVSADAEWRALIGAVAPGTIESSPLGEWFARDVAFADGQRRVIFVHGGWGKIAAAASTQYVIDRWHPRYLINLGTCGGLHGRASKGEIFLVEEAITYDIEERMGDSAEAIAHYTTRLDTPRVSSAAMAGLRRGRIVSADRDVRPADAGALSARYDAHIADWESSAIAHVARRNQARLYVIRAVSDVVSEAGSEAYGDIAVFEAESRVIMKRLVDLLGDVALEP
jgi:adenosylhomocysteine nucleosidase